MAGTSSADPIIISHTFGLVLRVYITHGRSYVIMTQVSHNNLMSKFHGHTTQIQYQVGFVGKGYIGLGFR